MNINGWAKLVLRSIHKLTVGAPKVDVESYENSHPAALGHKTHGKCFLHHKPRSGHSDGKVIKTNQGVGFGWPKTLS